MLELKQSATDKVIPFLLVSSTSHFAGARALFRVYVVLNTLNERGSNTVGVTRP
jgi:hypothetical protein